MSSQGPNFVGAGTDLGKNWTSTGNVTAEDGATATLTALPANNGEVLRCTMATNAFSVPVGATINGVLAEVKADYSDAFGGTVTYTKVQLVNGGTDLGTNQATGGPSSGALAWDSFGGSSSLWGASLTDTIVNSATFGVDISFSDGGSGPGQVNVDAVRLTVYYTVATDEMVVLHGSTGVSTVLSPPLRSTAALEFRPPQVPGPNSDTFENMQSRVSTTSYQPRMLLAAKEAYCVEVRPQNADLESAETINERVVIWEP